MASTTFPKEGGVPYVYYCNKYTFFTLICEMKCNVLLDFSGSVNRRLTPGHYIYIFYSSPSTTDTTTTTSLSSRGRLSSYSLFLFPPFLSPPPPFISYPTHHFTSLLPLPHFSPLPPPSLTMSHRTMGPPPDKDISMAPPQSYPPPQHNGALQPKREPSSGEIQEKYSRLKRRYFDLEQVIVLHIV